MRAFVYNPDRIKHAQWRSQNAEKVTRIKERLLYQSLILYKYVPFQIRTSLKGKNLLPESSFLSFKSSFLWYGKSLLPH